MFHHHAVRPDVQDLACGLSAAGLFALPAIVMAGGSACGMGTASATPYMRVAEHRPSICDAVLDPIHPAIGAQHLRSGDAVPRHDLKDPTDVPLV